MNKKTEGKKGKEGEMENTTIELVCCKQRLHFVCIYQTISEQEVMKTIRYSEAISVGTT